VILRNAVLLIFNVFEYESLSFEAMSATSEYTAESLGKGRLTSLPEEVIPPPHRSDKLRSRLCVYIYI